MGKRAISAVTFVLILFAAACLVTACKQKAPETERGKGVTAEDVKKEAEEAVGTAAQYTMQKKEEYRKEMEEKLAKLDSQIDELNADIRELGEKAKPEMQSAMQDLKEKREAANKKLAELKEASEAAWADIKRGLDASVQDLEAAYQRAKTHFEESGGEAGK